MNLFFKINCFIFAPLLFLPHVGAAKEILLNAVPLTMPQHLMRHYCFMRKIKLGEKNNLLTLVKINPEKVKHVKHEFLCDCGATTHATLDNFRRGNVKSCGCLNKARIMPPKVKKSEIGEKHNMLTLIKIDKTKPYAKGRHVFICECGNECTPELKAVRSGHTKSCGCIGFIPDEIKIECIDLYKNGLSCEDISNRTGFSISAIADWVRKAGVNRSCWGTRAKYNLDHKSFSAITEDSLYWAGFLAADGWVYNGKTIGLGLKKPDVGHIEKFRRFIKSDLPIHEKKHSFDISITSKEMADDLLKFGITPRKSLSYCPPEHCMNNRDFWRGMIDGDGGVYNKHGKSMVMLCGSKDAVFGFYNWAKTQTSFAAKPREKTPGFWNIRINCAPAIEIADKLYRDSITYLDRKFNTYKDFFHEKI